MLFEEVAAMLIEREELEYYLEEDDVPYRARSPSRFVAPEIVAVLGDVRRRLALLRGTRAATQRRGYRQDLQPSAAPRRRTTRRPWVLLGPATPSSEHSATKTCWRR